jgi:hypothetical protein
MMDRLLGPRFVVVTRVGITELGDSVVVIDEHAVVVSIPETGNDQPLRIPLSSIQVVSSTEEEIELLLRDGTKITFVATSTPPLRDEILIRCRAIPELTTALRAFGSRRGHRSVRPHATRDQQRFFAPLLDARRQAVAAKTPSAAMAAFDAGALTTAFDTALRELAAQRYGQNGPARRALEAELVDLAEPLHVALDRLREVATKASASDDLRVWRAWTRQLSATFEAADRVWLSMDAALDANPWKL